ncbi:MAG: hypothetical protein AAGD12_00965 [Pseudomonadota bacterium]
MPSIRIAKAADIAQMVPLLLADARQRVRRNPGLWHLPADPGAAVQADLTASLGADNTPIRRRWLLAEADGALAGIAHTMQLPVPPIYAGALGPPGLVMEASCVAETAPPGTGAALLAAAEADLTASGSRILLAASTPGDAWEAVFAAAGYDPLTQYLARTGLSAAPEPAAALAPQRGLGSNSAPPHASDQEEADRQDPPRTAVPQDVAGIVTLSARHRQILHQLNGFWAPHAEADARFGAWMAKSQTFPDRDMIVAEPRAGLTGYAIAQPATALHFPAPHDVEPVGFVDDFFHVVLDDPQELPARDSAIQRDAAALMRAAEAALVARGKTADLVVCPAAWRSKTAFLVNAGYSVAMGWSIKRV